MLAYVSCLLELCGSAQWKTLSCSSYVEKIMTYELFGSDLKNPKCVLIVNTYLILREYKELFGLGKLSMVASSHCESYTFLLSRHKPQ